MENFNILLLVVVIGFLSNVSLTHGRHLRKTSIDAFEKDDTNTLTTDINAATTGVHVPTTENDGDDDDTVIAKEEREAKKISSSLSSIKLNQIPHRIYVGGNEILQGFNEQLTKNHVDMKFTYELVEPKLCEMFNPPFGCCWDNRTVALGPSNEGCPVCKNKKKSCRKWKDQCGSQLVKDVCPETCGLCPKPKDTKCKDDPSQNGYCPLYSRFGLCKRDLIRKYCKQSCGVCSS